ncbi:MAG: Gfo/Idh/MocA family oxidoreductase [Chloroflexi bacterium]|nr:Gfo/Idh/MocA family oxidoreductase [Chloroflexota bacterium]
MSNTFTRIGVIGVGQIGKEHLKTYLEMPGVEVLAIAGRHPGRTEQVARDYGIPSWTTDYRTLLTRDDIDAVSVCLHNNLHRPVTIAALEAGKHVYCEKPMAGSYRDAAEMLDAAHRTGKLLSIQLSTLFDLETKASKAVIDAGWLGKPYYACSAGSRRRGRPYVDGYGSPAFVQKSQAAGGALYDMGVYHIANLLYLLGNPAALRISGRTYQEMPIDPARFQGSGYDVEEFGAGFAHLEQNITLSIVEAWAVHLDQLGGSYILGSLGGVRLQPFGIFRSLGDLDLDAKADLEDFDYRLKNVHAEGDAYTGPQQHFIAALRGLVPLLPMAEIALNTMLISEGIYLSDRLGREVTAQEVREQSHSTALEG